MGKTESDQYPTVGGSKSRNKVAVGEPAAGSLSNINNLMFTLDLLSLRLSLSQGVGRVEHVSRLAGRARTQPTNRP